jgi:hypothetical protein
MHRPLIGGQIQRVTLSALGGREIALLKVRVPPGQGASRGENVDLVVVGTMGVGVVDPEGCARLRDALRSSAAPDQARWRAHIEGGRVVGIDERGIAIAREGRSWRAGLAGAGALVLAAEPAVSSTTDPDREKLIERGSRIVEELVRAEVVGWRDALRRALVKSIARLDRRIAAVGGDLARTQSADAEAERARLFVAQASRAPRGATKLAAIDWSSGAPLTVEISLDPARGAQEQIAALFKRARRLKEAGQTMRDRLADAQSARAALAAVANDLSTGEKADLDRLEARARAAAPRDFRLQSGSASSSLARSRIQAPLPAFRAFVGISGARILVGRGAAHNDTLTFRVASPHHLWLHAKNCVGAHVVVPLDKGATCPGDTLVEAAHLAAHFSDARDESIVEVQYTPRRYVRKPRGSAPGLVVVDREKVIVLRREDALLRRLLERETP